MSSGEGFDVFAARTPSRLISASESSPVSLLADICCEGPAVFEMGEFEVLSI